MNGLITLQFCAFRSFFGRIIDWGTEGEVGHVDAVFQGSLLGAQQEAGLGGAESGVQWRPATYVKECGGYNIFRVTLEASVDQRTKFQAFLTQQLGKPYDTKGILGFVTGKDWRDPGSWFCSELQAAALEHAGLFPHPLHVWKNRVTPQELLLVTSALGKVTKVS